MKSTLIPALFATLALLTACNRTALDIDERDSVVNVAPFPCYDDTKAIGIPDAGKKLWEENDILYIVLQTETDSLSFRYRLTYDGTSWGSLEKFSYGKFVSAKKLFADDMCRVRAYYAPAYTYSSDDTFEFLSGKTLGTEEFFRWSSGNAYDIDGTSAISLSISFHRDYSRIRVSSAESYTIKLSSAKFTPAGYCTTALGSKTTLVAVADSNANAFFYGRWPEGTAITINAFDENGSDNGTRELTNRPASANGESYALLCYEEPSDYTKLSDFTKTITSTTGKSYSIKLKNAVVSYVFNKYVHLEDASGAILLFDCAGDLEVGDLINGEVSGTAKLFRNVPQFVSFDHSKATIVTTDKIPLTEITLANLLKDYGSWINRRIVLKGVTISKGTSSSSRTGTVTQDGNTINMYATYTTSPAVLKTGLEGDLITFPTYHNTDKQVSLYEASQFFEGGIEEEEEAEQTAFTALTNYGFYTATNTETPAAAVAYTKYQDQLNYDYTSSSRSFCIINVDGDNVSSVSIPTKTVKVGAIFDATVSINGAASETHTVKVVKKSSTCAWLEDKTNNVGYIIAL